MRLDAGEDAGAERLGRDGQGTVEGRVGCEACGDRLSPTSSARQEGQAATCSQSRSASPASRTPRREQSETVAISEVEEGHARASPMAVFIRASARLSELFTVPRRTPRVDAISSRDRSEKWRRVTTARCLSLRTRRPTFDGAPRVFGVEVVEGARAHGGPGRAEDLRPRRRPRGCPAASSAGTGRWPR